MRFGSLISFVASVAVLGAPALAGAQDAAPAEPASPPAPAPEAAAPAAPAAEPAPQAAAATTEPVAAEATAAPAAAAPAAEPPPEEEKEEIPAYFRVDHDTLNLQLWFGATFPIGPLKLATDVYMDSADYGEFDIGPELDIGLGGDNILILIPMVGIGFNWGQHKASAIVAPQLYAYLTVGPIYLESWWQTFLYSPLADGADDSLYTRNFILYNISDTIGIGPQLEATFALNNTGGEAGRDSVTSMPVGAHTNLHYGANNTLGLFLGYETVENARQIETGAELDPVTGELIPTYSERALAGRIDFTHLW